MNRSKKLGILSCILVVVCIATVILTQYEEKKEQIKNSEETILAISPDSVSKLSWESEESRLGFHKNDSTVWLYDDDENFPVNEEKVSELLEIFSDFGSSFTINDVDDYSQYGIDEPICTIHIEADSKTYDIKLGDFSTMDSKRYVSIGDGNVYLVNTDPSDSFDIDIKDMIKTDEALAYDSISKITFSGNSAYSIQYIEDSTSTVCDEDVYFTKDGSNYLPLDTERVEDYLGEISGVNMENYVTYNATDEEIAAYGLNNPKLTVTVEYKKDKSEVKTYTLNLGRSPEEADEDDDSDYQGYVRIGNSKIIYEISSYDYETLLKAGYNDLRHKELFTADFDTVTSVDVSLEGNKYTLSAEEKDGAYEWKYNDKEISINEVKTALTALRADSFTTDEATGKEEISLVLHLDHKNYSEQTIKLYRQDGTKCVAVVNGKPMAIVERSLVVDLIEAVNGIVLD